MGAPSPALGRPPVRWARRTAAAAWVAAVLVVGLIVLVVPPTPGSAARTALVVAIGLVPLTLGALVARTVRAHPAGPLLALAGLCFVAANLVPVDITGPAAGTWMLLYLPLALLLLTVPDGRPRSSRWAAAGWALTVVVVLFIALCAMQWAAPSAGLVLSIPLVVVLACFLVLLVVCAIAPVVRFRHGDLGERLRLRWIFLAGASLPLTLLLCWTSYLLVGTAELVGVGLVLMYLAIPLGTAVAILRPDLFDIDRATVATAAGTVLAVGLLAVLSVACAAVGVSLVHWSPAASITVLAVLTALATIVFPMLLRRLDRLLYPERARTIAALDQLSARIEAGRATPAALEETLRQALRDPGLRVACRDVGGRRLLLLDGTVAPPTEGATAVRMRGEEVGALLSSPGRRLPVAVARACAPLLEAVRTQAVLRQARSEVEASRERLLRAGYEERRRLERDLHDGVQQRLVALGMRLRVLQRTSPADPALDAALDAAVAELGTAVAELRRIAHGVRPSALDDGLGAALADLTRLAPDVVELEVRVSGLPDVVATTAYYVASEALANALRHAGASRVRIAALARDGELWVRVHDDGRGGARLTPTGGLTGLADRVAAVGGELHVDSRPGAGTTIGARLPCGS